MMHKKHFFILGYGLFTFFIVSAFCFLVFLSLGYSGLPASYSKTTHTIDRVQCQIDGKKEFEIDLPGKIHGLSPLTPISVYTEIKVETGDSLLIKSVFSPTKLYLNDALVYEYGQNGTYPGYLNDPPTFLTIIPLPESGEKVTLRVEYLSPTQRNELAIPAVIVGNELAIFQNLFQKDGFILLCAILIIFLGGFLAIVALTLIGRVASGLSFFWLGMFSLLSGCWVLGECDLTVFFIPYPSLLYLLDYISLFSLTLPLLLFGLMVLNPRNKYPLKVMVGLHAASLCAAVLLQITGIVDFTKTLYWFHIIAPLGFIVFSGDLLYEHFRYRNPVARRFAPAITLLAGFVLLEVFNYWFQFTPLLTVFFLLGILAFIISLGIICSFYVQESIQAVTEKKRLEYEVSAINKQLEFQRTHYQKLAQNEHTTKLQRHDLRHQLTAIWALSDNRDKLKVYINTLIMQIPTDRNLIFCDNHSVNAVAAYYYSMAEEQGIEISIEMAIPRETEAVQETDLCVVVGNLLENAVESCMKIMTGKRFIQLNCVLCNGCIVIAMDNSFNGKVHKHNGLFLSSKRKDTGIGLSSIVAIAEKYEGAATFKTSDDTFYSSIYFKLMDL